MRLDPQSTLKIIGGVAATIAGFLTMSWTAGSPAPHEWLYLGGGVLVLVGIIMAGDAIGENVGVDAKNGVATFAMIVAGAALYRLSPYGLNFWPAPLGSVMVVFAIFGLVSMISKGVTR